MILNESLRLWGKNGQHGGKVGICGGVGRGDYFLVCTFLN